MRTLWSSSPQEARTPANFPVAGFSNSSLSITWTSPELNLEKSAERKARRLCFLLIENE